MKTPAHVKRAEDYWKDKEKKVWKVRIGGAITWVRARTVEGARETAEANQYGRRKHSAASATLADPVELQAKWS